MNFANRISQGKDQTNSYKMSLLQFFSCFHRSDAKTKIRVVAVLRLCSSRPISGPDEASHSDFEIYIFIIGVPGSADEVVLIEIRYNHCGG